jgi:predicted transposase YbfD/YdcC
MSSRLDHHFASLTDPRERKVVYPLLNVITIAICAVISGANDFVAIAKWGRTKTDWLAQFLDMSSGVPSHDRFNAIFAAIKPDEFEKCLLSWITSIHELVDSQIVAIDGKTLRGSYNKASAKSAIHMVSAWATANQISLGQVVVDAKSNEITAIPKLLEILELSGCIVTIDAMGCQTEIASKIKDGKADYCLAVKGNQPTLHEGIQEYFQEHLQDDFAGVKVRRHATRESGHGRQEQRQYFICPLPKDLPDRERWEGLKAIGMVVQNVVRDGKNGTEVRYYLLSKYLSGRRFAEAVRGHWGIENNLHWQLDVTFDEDACRIRQGHADANFSALRRLALGLLKNETTAKVGIHNKRLLAAWDDEYLKKVLFGP